MRIIFMGTPDFAVESLKKLVENNYDVVAVVTMPDKPVGRHHDTLQASPVKQYAVGHGIPVLQPERLKDEAFLEELRSYRADLQVVVAFRMLPEVVWAMPPQGTFNLHAALLPQYRGAAPINWAVINGETETGVTTFFLDHDIDTGRIIHRVSVPIADTDTVGDVHDRLMVLGADLVLRTVDDIAAGSVEAVEQESLIGNEESSSARNEECRFAPNEELRMKSEEYELPASSERNPYSSFRAEGAILHSSFLHPAPKLTRENTQIRWSQHTVKSAYDFIRGLSPYPGAWTTLVTADGKETQLKVFFAEKITNEELRMKSEEYKLPVSIEGNSYSSFRAEGVILHSSFGGEAAASLLVPLRDGYLRLTDIQLAGKRRMPAADFLRGAHLEGATLKEC